MISNAFKGKNMMKNLKILSSSLFILSLVGCSSTQTKINIGEQVKIDKEPIILGVPLNQKVQHSDTRVSEQLDLLTKIKEKKFIGTYEMVQHNNDLDARKNSDRTLPKAYAFEQDQSQIKEVTTVTQDTKEVSAFDQKLKVLDWDNNSANDLGEMFAKSLGYSFKSVASSNNSDVNVSFKVRNVTISQALEEFKKSLGKKADLIVSEKTKTLMIQYK